MTNLRQAAQQALEVLENDAMQRTYAGGVRITNAAIALRAALAEPEQEPVAWMDIDDNGQRLTVRQWSDGNKDEVPLYTAPTPRKPLTDEEIDRVTDHQWAQNNHKPIYAAHRAYARAIERAHGIGEQHE